MHLSLQRSAVPNTSGTLQQSSNSHRLLNARTQRVFCPLCSKVVRKPLATHCQLLQHHCVMDPDSVWNGLSDVERTSLLVALLRWNGSKYCWQSGPNKGQPLYSDPYGELWVNNCIPQKQQQTLMQQSNYDQLPDLAAARTAELDNQIVVALDNSSNIQQMVILGAGTDTRAWRLEWPAGFVIYEVDSQSVFDFKSRVMAAAAAQEQQQVPKLACDRRVEVAADASKPEDLWQHLASAGFDADKATLYLLEGFIGYLTVQASNALLAYLHQHSAPGSHIVITAPPPPADEARSAAAVEASGTADHTAAVGDGDGKVEPMKLYHSTFEEPTKTLERLRAAGWSDCQLLTKEQLTAKYGVAHAQPILVGRK